MQWRINQANHDWVAFASLGINHRLEDTFEVATLERQQLVKRSLAFFLALCQDHLLHNGQALLLHKHMLCAAESNAFSAECYSTFGITWIISICPHAQLAELYLPTLAVASGQPLYQSRRQLS